LEYLLLAYHNASQEESKPMIQNMADWQTIQKFYLIFEHIVSQQQHHFSFYILNIAQKNILWLVQSLEKKMNLVRKIILKLSSRNI